MRITNLTLSTVLALGVTAAGSARADDQSDDPGTGRAATADHADPQAKKLPSHAADKAQENAFGQQGARQRAAHQAAKAAAVAAAKSAPAGATDHPTAPAHGKAQDQASNSHAQAGVAQAAAARAAHGASVGRPSH
jgi:hypothetical protein